MSTTTRQKLLPIADNNGVFCGTQFYLQLTELAVDADNEIAEQAAEIEWLNRIIDGMLECANNCCRCGHGGICSQCREMVVKHRKEPEAGQ